jgi:hypothetical protein
MIHQGQGLALGFKASDNAFGVHAQLDDLEGHAAANGFLLFGHIDDAAAAFANLLEKLVTADAVARFFGRDCAFGSALRQFVEKNSCLIVDPEQGFNLSAQGSIARTGLIQIYAASISGQFQGSGKHHNFRVGRFVHGHSIIYPLIREIDVKRGEGISLSEFSDPAEFRFGIKEARVGFQPAPMLSAVSLSCCCMSISAF